MTEWKWDNFMPNASIRTKFCNAYIHALTHTARTYSVKFPLDIMEDYVTICQMG